MERKPNIYVFASLFLVLIIDTMGFGIIMPVLPSLFLDPNVSMLPNTASIYIRDFYYGLTMAVFFIFTFLGSPIMGDLSDQLGRKKVLLLCLLSTAFGYFISTAGILLKSLTLLILGRAVCGLAAGSQPISQAAIIDVSTEENKTFNIGLITLAGSVGFIIGPIMGGYFSNILPSGSLSYSLPFVAAALLAIINMTSLQFSLQETYKPSHKRRLSITQSLMSFKTAIILKPLHVLSIVYVFIQLGWSIFFQYTALFLANSFHYTSDKIGLFMAYLGLIFVFSLSVLMRSLLTILSLYSLIVSSLLMILFGLITTLIFKNELALWLGVIPITIGNALGYAAITSVFSNRVDKDSQGMVMGLVGSLGSVSWVIGSLSMGILSPLGQSIPFIVIVIFETLGLILLYFDSRRYKF